MKAKYFIALSIIFFMFMSAGCGGSGGRDVSLQNESGGDTDTQTLVNKLIAEGVLNSDGTLPYSAVNYNTSTSAKSLSKTTATQVTQGEALNPVHYRLASRLTSGACTSIILSRLQLIHPAFQAQK